MSAPISNNLKRSIEPETQPPVPETNKKTRSAKVTTIAQIAIGQLQATQAVKLTAKRNATAISVANKRSNLQDTWGDPKLSCLVPNIKRGKLGACNLKFRCLLLSIIAAHKTFDLTKDHINFILAYDHIRFNPFVNLANLVDNPLTEKLFIYHFYTHFKLPFPTPPTSQEALELWKNDFIAVIEKIESILTYKLTLVNSQLKSILPNRNTTYETSVKHLKGALYENLISEFDKRQANIHDLFEKLGGISANNITSPLSQPYEIAYDDNIETVLLSFCPNQTPVSWTDFNQHGVRQVAKTLLKSISETSEKAINITDIFPLTQHLIRCVSTGNLAHFTPSFYKECIEVLVKLQPKHFSSYSTNNLEIRLTEFLLWCKQACKENNSTSKQSTQIPPLDSERIAELLDLLTWVNQHVESVRNWKHCSEHSITNCLKSFFEIFKQNPSLLLTDVDKSLKCMEKLLDVITQEFTVTIEQSAKIEKRKCIINEILLLFKAPCDLEKIVIQPSNVKVIEGIHLDPQINEHPELIKSVIKMIDETNWHSTKNNDFLLELRFSLNYPNLLLREHIRKLLTKNAVGLFLNDNPDFPQDLKLNLCNLALLFEGIRVNTIPQKPKTAFVPQLSQLNRINSTDMRFTKELLPKKWLWNKNHIEGSETLIYRLGSFTPEYKTISKDKIDDFLKMLDSRWCYNYIQIISLIHLGHQMDQDLIFIKGNRFNQRILTSAFRISDMDKGFLIHYLTLMNTPYSQKVRDMLKGLVKKNSLNIPSHYDPASRTIPWYSFEEQFNKIKTTLKEFKSTGKAALNNIRTQSRLDLQVLSLDEKTFILQCDEAIKYCNLMMDRLNLGDEGATVPAYYHGVGTNQTLNQGDQIVPQTLLTKDAKIIQNKTESGPNFAGAFVADTIVPEYFGSAIALSDVAIHCLPNHKWLNLSYARIKGLEPQARELWIGIQNHILLRPSTESSIEVAVSSNNEMPPLYNPKTIVTIITPSFRQQDQLNRNAGLQDLPLLGTLSGFIFEQARAASLAKWVPSSKTTFKDLPKALYLKMIDMIKFYKTARPVSIRNDLIAFFYENNIEPLTSNRAYSHQELTKLLKLSLSFPVIARKEILEGALTKIKGVPTPLNQSEDDPDKARQSREEFNRERKIRTEQFKRYRTLFPTIPQPPVMRHVWDDHLETEKNDPLYTQVVGNHPLHIINLPQVQRMLLHYTHALWNTYSEEAKSDFLNPNCSVRDHFFTHLALNIIVYSILGRANSELLIVPYLDLKYGRATTIFIDHNTFDTGETHGRDLRHCRNEPFYIAKMMELLSSSELAILREKLKAQTKPTFNASEERIEAVYELLSQLGKAISQRYFFGQLGRRALPQRISNACLTHIFTTENPPNELVSRTNDCLTDYNSEIKIEPKRTNESIFKFIKYQAIRRSKIERIIANSNLPINYFLIDTPIHPNEELWAIAENIIRLIKADLKGNHQLKDPFEIAKKLFRKLPIEEKIHFNWMISQLSFEEKKQIIAKATELTGKEFPKENSQLLSDATKYAKEVLNPENPHVKEWVKHIETYTGKRGDAPCFYFCNPHQEWDGTVRFYKSLPENANGWFACPKIAVDAFLNEPKCIEDENHIVINLGKDDLPLNPIVMNPKDFEGTKFSIAQFIIGETNNSQGKFPMLKREVAQLYHDFFEWTKRT